MPYAVVGYDSCMVKRYVISFATCFGRQYLLYNVSILLLIQNLKTSYDITKEQPHIRYCGNYYIVFAGEVLIFVFEVVMLIYIS